MSFYEWYLVDAINPSDKYILKGFVTDVDRAMAEKRIVRSFDEKTFEEYSLKNLRLVVLELDTWEI